MKKILLVGNCPLPEENTKSRPAAGLRTYQFFEPLIRAGFFVKLITIAMPECYEKDSPLVNEENDSFSRISISKEDPLLTKKIQQIYDEFQPEAVISVNTYPSYITANLQINCPFWADLNGWIMAEAQAQAYKMDDNAYLPHYLKMQQQILRVADKFSTVSATQQFTLLGELSALYRLNKETFSYNFVNHIPNATMLFESEKNARTASANQKLQNLPENAFVLLWLGGYNTWVDEETLFKGVEDAMGAYEEIYFVSTGGGIAGLDNKTFENFMQMVDESAFKDRFVFLGWVDSNEIPSLYERADVGLNVDRLCVETLTGARNRINEMMKFGLPVLTTFGSEIAQDVKENEAGVVVPSGKYELLAHAIMQMYEDKDSSVFEDYGKAGIEYTQKNDYQAVLSPLLNWLKSPKQAPDKGVKISQNARFIKYLKQNGIKKSIKRLFRM
jgi:glycosyltransferase involved in cell wall biosynthesis